MKNLQNPRLTNTPSWKAVVVSSLFLILFVGLEKFFKFWGCFPGPRDRVVQVLRNGDLVSVAPGGVREAFFSENYSVVWGKRQGFAKAALEAKVVRKLGCKNDYCHRIECKLFLQQPIIPVFTENIREAFEYMQTGKGIDWYEFEKLGRCKSSDIFTALFKKFYERTRWPLRPLYGGFPVKLITYVGKPIRYEANVTPEELVTKVSFLCVPHVLRQLPYPPPCS